ncbi:MAG: sugar ABC transporter substrate-binding protein, partial [Candidatus Omnitrophica bacterium]|nr:sugar ABC transporter substrate-binding protein [Candidatus Omnitrophota bacterium]
LIAVAILGWWLFTPRSESLPEGVVQISFGSFGSPQQVDVYREIIRRFEEENPNIRVDLCTPSSGAYFQKLKTEMAARIAPDVTWVDVSAFYSFADKNVFRPLEEFARNDPEFHREDYFEGIIQAFTHEGELYALPKSCGSMVLFYNQDHFDEAGIPYPDETWTWDRMVEECAKLTRDTDGDGRVDRYALAPLDLLDLLAQYEVPILSPNRDECVLDSPEAFRVCKFLRDLTFEARLIPSAAQIGGFGVSSGAATGGGRGGASIGIFDLFTLEKVSMIVTDLVLSLVYEKAPFRWDIAPQPAGSVRGGFLNGAGYAMNARTDHPKEAWELIKFLAGPEVQKLRAKGGDSLPSMTRIAESDLFLKNPKPPASRSATLSQLKVAIPPPKHERWPRVLLEIGSMTQNFMSTEDPEPIDAALAETTHIIDRVLEGKE